MENGIYRGGKGHGPAETDRGTAMDEQSKQFIEESDAVDREEFERLNAQRVERSLKKDSKRSEPDAKAASSDARPSQSKRRAP